MNQLRPDRTLVVLADGAQAAFAAGAVAVLAEAGTSWARGLAAGLGAQVALLALADEAAEAERRWRRQAEDGSTLFRPRLARERERIGADQGLLVLPDPWRAEGWLDGECLREHLAPDQGGWAGRLRAAGALLEVGVLDLSTGVRHWLEADGVGEVDLLRASASFAGGWGPIDAAEGKVWWGGAAALASSLPDLEPHACDVVCGFPVPALGRGHRQGLAELIQVRDEAAAAAAVSAWVDRHQARGGRARLIAPGVDSYATWSSRPAADLALEWPLPAERNAELTVLAVEYGRHVAGAVAAAARH